MATGPPADTQGSGKRWGKGWGEGWGEAAPGDPTGASRWGSTSSGGEHVVIPPEDAFGSIDLFGTPELVFNGSAVQRDAKAGAANTTRMIDPDLAPLLLQGGETWVSVAFRGVRVPVRADRDPQRADQHGEHRAEPQRRGG